MKQTSRCPTFPFFLMPVSRGHQICFRAQIHTRREKELEKGRSYKADAASHFSGKERFSCCVQKMPLRLCYLKNFSNNWVPDSSPAGGHFTFLFSNIKLRMSLRMDSNISVHGESRVGQLIDPLTDSYDGCIGR